MTARSMRVGLGFGPKTLRVTRTFVNALGVPIALRTSSSSARTLSVTRALVPVVGENVTLSYSGASVPAPTNFMLVQQGGTSNSTAPVGNSSAFAFTSVAGASSYNVYRRVITNSFSAPPAWGAALTSVSAATAASNFTAMGSAGIVIPSGPDSGFTDGTATGTNITDLSGPATVYQYALTAVVGGVEGAMAYPACYPYRGKTLTSGADFSGGGASVNYTSTANSPSPGPNCIAVTYAGSGQFLPVIAPPLAQGANGFPNDLEIGGFKYMVGDVLVPDSQWSTHRMDFGVTSRVPTSGGDAFSWQNNNNFWSGGTPVPGSWATMKILLTDINIGMTTFTGSIVGTSNTNTVGAPAGWGTGTLTVTACTAPNFVDNAMYVTSPSGLTGSALTIAIGTAGAPTGVGTYTVVGPGITTSTNTGSQTMTGQRTNDYKSGFQSKPDMTGTVVLYWNNIGYTTT